MKPPRPALRRFPWLPALAPLLLAMFFATSQLDNRAFQEDELATLRLAGSSQRQPLAFPEFQAMLADRSAEQAWGWPLLVSLWVRIAGWSEPAVRTLPLLSGMLALAMTWRLGRDLFHHSVGLTALLMLATSSLFTGYMWYARAFTTVALCSTLLLWCYWRVRFRGESARPVHYACLLLAATGLAYLHYFAVLPVVALALFHLGGRRDGRRFRLPLALFALAGLLAAPQLPTLLAGLGETLVDDNLKLSVLGAPQVLTAALHALFNYTFVFPALTGWLLLALLTWLLLRGTRQVLMLRGEPDPKAFLALVFALTLSLALAANEAVGAITPGRIRYLMPLWPVLALLLACTIREQRTWRFRVAEWVLVALIVTGLLTFSLSALRYSFNASIFRDRMHLVHRELLASASPGDLLLAGEFDNNFIWSLVREYYLESLPLSVSFLEDEGPENWLAGARQHPRFWLLRTSHDGEDYRALANSLPEEAYLCDRPDLRAIATLELYAWSAEDCRPTESATAG